jgi:hypothetical protein
VHVELCDAERELDDARPVVDCVTTPEPIEEA